MMKKWRVFLAVFLVLFLAACNNDEKLVSEPNQIEPAENQPAEVSEHTDIHHELLFQLEFLPHEIGTSMSVIQDENLYNTWAEIFQFETVPKINFTTEEVLFVTTYSNGCGLVFENVTMEGDTLLVKLNYPEDIRSREEIVCTEIAIPQTFVVKMEKTGATKGTLMQANHILLEGESILQ